MDQKDPALRSRGATKCPHQCHRQINRIAIPCDLFIFLFWCSVTENCFSANAQLAGEDIVAEFEIFVRQMAKRLRLSAQRGQPMNRALIGFWRCARYRLLVPMLQSSPHAEVGSISRFFVHA